jgi:predicted CopG family antitoxin
MTKVISLSDAAYQDMKSVKQYGESFSDVVNRLISATRPKPLSEFFGKWPGAEEAVQIKKKLYEERRRFKTRDVSL